jgi:hypothetical protein
MSSTPKGLEKLHELSCGTQFGCSYNVYKHDIYICKTTGLKHRCNNRCTLRIASHRGDICPISGRSHHSSIILSSQDHIHYGTYTMETSSLKTKAKYIDDSRNNSDVKKREYLAAFDGDGDPHDNFGDSGDVYHEVINTLKIIFKTIEITQDDVEAYAFEITKLYNFICKYNDNTPDIKIITLGILYKSINGGLKYGNAWAIPKDKYLKKILPNSNHLDDGLINSTDGIKAIVIAYENYLGISKHQQLKKRKIISSTGKLGSAKNKHSHKKNIEVNKDYIQGDLSVYIRKHKIVKEYLKKRDIELNGEFIPLGRR